MPLLPSHTHSLPVMGRGTCFFSLDYVVCMYIFIGQSQCCGWSMWYMFTTGVAKLSISQSSRTFHPVILLITTCLDVYYITIHNTLIPCVCVCAWLYFIEDLCSLPFCAIVRVSCVVLCSYKATEIQVESKSGNNIPAVTVFTTGI